MENKHIHRSHFRSERDSPVYVTCVTPVLSIRVSAHISRCTVFIILDKVWWERVSVFCHILFTTTERVELSHFRSSERERKEGSTGIETTDVFSSLEIGTT